jgi:hypothetical protein
MSYHRAWLNAASRDQRLPGNAFRLAYAISHKSVHGRLSVTMHQLQKIAGLASDLTVRQALDRLAALGYLRYDRKVRGQPIEIEIIPPPSRSKPRPS